MKPIMINSHFKTDSKYDREWREKENKAIVDAGFELRHVESNHFGVENPFTDLAGRHVTYRCYANQERMLDAILNHEKAVNIVPNIDQANEWYKIIDRYDLKFFGRRIGYLNLKKFGYLEEYKQMRSFETLLRSMFDGHSSHGKSFVKSSTKSSFAAQLRDYKSLLEELTFALGVSCHNTPTELIFSEPLRIKPADTEYKREEYRTFVINGYAVTTSLFTDTPSDRDYSHVNRFVRKFAKKYGEKLPKAYCIDTCRDQFLGMVVVELNGFAASGFFADHNLNTLFAHLRALSDEN